MRVKSNPIRIPGAARKIKSRTHPAWEYKVIWQNHNSSSYDDDTDDIIEQGELIMKELKEQERRWKLFNWEDTKTK